MSTEAEDRDYLERLDTCSQPPMLVGSSEVLRRAVDETEFLFHGAIPAAAVTLIVGAPGEAKSWLAYAMAMAVARGHDWLGARNMLRTPRSVLLLNYDNPTPELGRRFKRLGLQPDHPVYFHSADLVPADAALLLPDADKLLRGLAGKTRAACVVVDSLREAHTANENDSSDMAPIMRQLRALTLPHGAAVVVLHHTNKNLEATGIGGLRGSTAIPAGADAVVSCGDGVARWLKHRGWPLEPEAAAVGFEVVDPRPGQTEVRTRMLRKGKKAP